MDSTVLLEIISLGLFIAGFQPLVRRAGAYANLWFLGWLFLLVHEVVQSLTVGPAGAPWLGRLAASCTLHLCGLAFLAAAANSSLSPGGPITAEQQLDPLVTVELALPVLAQCALCIVPAHDGPSPPLIFSVTLLYLVPFLQMLLARERSRALMRIGIAFAAFGLVSACFVHRFPDAVLGASLPLLFWCSAYLYLVGVPRWSRGRIAALVGLITAGISYPLHRALTLYRPELHLERVLFQLPQYLIVAGVSLTLLEEHVLRTERMANYDPLTDLPNRRLFEERLIATMEEARASRTTVACLVIDVDNFKTVNDTLGHSAGDQLLRQLAVRLSWHIGPRDILARTGGDEFTALLAGVTDEHHLRFIASAMMSAASVPIMIDSGAVDVRISVGIALSPDHADDIDSLRRAADQAMYTAKRRGGSLLAFAGDE